MNVLPLRVLWIHRISHYLSQKKVFRIVSDSTIKPRIVHNLSKQEIPSYTVRIHKYLEMHICDLNKF